MNTGFTIWFTGLSGAGKTTISRRVAAALRGRGYKVEVLDGDVVRENLSKGLGFTKEDRDTNIRRIGFVCDLLTRNGIVAIAAAISPYRAIRDENRARVGRFIEVYCECPVDVLAERDVKGLYKKALRGEIKNFTGVDDPYEAPLAPEVTIRSDRETEDESVAQVLARLQELGYIAPYDGAYWQRLDALVQEHALKVERPIGTPHPKYPEHRYPLDYGYLDGTLSEDGEAVDVWVGTAPERRIVGVLCALDSEKRDSEVKLLLGCTPAEQRTLLDFSNIGARAATLVERPANV